MKKRGSTSPAQIIIANARPVVIGHRGYSHIAPENTLPSFELALATGADLVELDYHYTRDGVPVVIHDLELDRTTDACQRWGRRHIRVATRTMAELALLDAGGWFDAKYAGTRLPQLSEAIETIHQGSIPLIEHKAGRAPEMVRWLRERGWINRVIVQSFDWEYLRQFHEREPGQVLGALGPASRLPGGKKPFGISRRLNSRWLAQAAKAGVRAVVWNRQVSKRAVRLAHEQGLKVWVYTVDDARLARRLLDAGVDGIITNNPATPFSPP